MFFKRTSGGPVDRHSLAIDSPASHNALKKKDSYLMATEGEGSTGTGNLLNTNFSTVTLTVQTFYKQVSNEGRDPRGIKI